MFCKRITGICDKVSQEQWYQNLQDRLIEIRKQLPEAIMDQYDSICEEINIRSMDAVYSQAFEDGQNKSSS